MPSKSTHDFTGNDVSSRQSVHVFNPAGYTTPQDYPETQSQTSSTVAFEALNTPPKRSNSKRRGLLKKLARPFHKKHDDSGPTMSEGEARALVSDTGALSRYPDVGPAPGHTGVVLPVESMKKDEARRQRRRSPLAYDSTPPQTSSKHRASAALLSRSGNTQRLHRPLEMTHPPPDIRGFCRKCWSEAASSTALRSSYTSRLYRGGVVILNDGVGIRAGQDVQNTTSFRLCVSASSDLRGGPFSSAGLTDAAALASGLPGAKGVSLVAIG
ncbi:hypothetical protein NMY22_g13625 [Coprinellus aureogranulatus]|nr:hypothetical protein NMY22_g13625 [Coprinellus aureogranulatus]